MQRTAVSATKNAFDHRTVLRGKEVGHFYPGIGTGGDKAREPLLHALRTTEAHMRRDIDLFAVLGEIGRHRVERTGVRSVGVERVITRPNDPGSILCCHCVLLVVGCTLSQVHGCATLYFVTE